jgi:hypothetical protein
MHKEKPNNPLSDKLDGMNSLPEGFGFSATRVWDQLEQQLQTQPAKPKWLWMRYAAAIVLLAGAAIFWILQKEVATPKDSFTKQSIEQAPINQQSAIKIETTSETESPELLAKKQMPVKKDLPISINQVPESTQFVQTSIPLEPNPIKDSIQTSETIAIAISSPTVTTKPAVKSTPVRKKYPVVHLYDLYREPEPIYTKSAPKRTITETDESPIAPVETNRSFWLPKTKPVIITTSLTDNQ